MIAFVPYQDRPLETWLLAFFRAVYSPTIYTYKKVGDKKWLESRSKANSDDETGTEKSNGVVMEGVTKNRERVDEFIKSLPSVKHQEEIAEIVLDRPQEDVQSTVVDAPSREKEQKREMTEVAKTTSTTDTNYGEKPADLQIKKDKLSATAVADFGSIPMPGRPTTPNIVVGMVTDKNGKIIEGAIVEIQDDKGNPTRVVQTNSLGQFKISSPLANGKYLVIPDKEEMKFDRVEIVLSGQIVEPIRIKEIQ